MLDQLFTTQFWHDHGPTIAAAWPLLLLALVIGGVVMRLIDGGEIRGLKSSNQALKDQLDLATKNQSALTPEIEHVKVDIAELKKAQAELKDAHTPELEKLSAKTASIERRLDAISQSNTALGRILQIEAGSIAMTGSSTLLAHANILPKKTLP